MIVPSIDRWKLSAKPYSISHSTDVTTDVSMDYPPFLQRYKNLVMRGMQGLGFRGLGRLGDTAPPPVTPYNPSDVAFDNPKQFIAAGGNADASGNLLLNDITRINPGQPPPDSAKFYQIIGSDRVYEQGKFLVSPQPSAGGSPGNPIAQHYQGAPNIGVGYDQALNNALNTINQLQQQNLANGSTTLVGASAPGVGTNTTSTTPGFLDNITGWIQANPILTLVGVAGLGFLLFKGESSKRR